MQKRKIIVFSPTESYELHHIANSTISETGDRDLYKSFLPNPLMIMITYSLSLFFNCIFFFFFFFFDFSFCFISAVILLHKESISQPQNRKK